MMLAYLGEGSGENPRDFSLAELSIYDGDPGLGVWLVPIGAALLFYSIARIALDLSKRK